MGVMASQITGVASVYTAVFLQVQIKENLKVPRHWLCVGKSPLTGEFPAQKASNAENVSIWWRHHVCVLQLRLIPNHWKPKELGRKHSNFPPSTVPTEGLAKASTGQALTKFEFRIYTERTWRINL